MTSSNHEHSKGQFFSFDVIAGSVIFLLAFFLVAFYWFNAQSQLSEQTDDLQREAERIADQLLVPGEISPLPSNWWYKKYFANPGGFTRIDDYVVVPYVHLASESEELHEINLALLWDLITMSDANSYQFYPQVKEKLGIPRYEFYITLEDTSGNLLNAAGGGCQDPATPIFTACEAGKPPTAGAREIAIAERIVLIDHTHTDSTPHELAKLRVRVWRP